jgi:hypothetical protein
VTGVEKNTHKRALPSRKAKHKTRRDVRLGPKTNKLKKNSNINKCKKNMKKQEKRAKSEHQKNRGKTGEKQQTIIIILFIEMIFDDTSSAAQGGDGSFKNRKPIGEVGCCESGVAERSH